MKVEEIVKERILDQLNKGAAPWRNPYAGAAYAINRFSKKGYRGINLMLVMPGEYGSFAQWHKLGYHPERGTKSTVAVFWKRYLPAASKSSGVPELPGLDDNGGAWVDVRDLRPRFVLRYYNIFERSQVVDKDGKHPESIFPKPDRPEVPADQLNVRAAALLHSYMGAAGITYRRAVSGCAYYMPGSDVISVPEGMTPDDEIQTTAHECIHSTGAANRLNRDLKGVNESRGSYSREELIAETGAGLLTSRMLGINRADLENSANYCASWAKYIAGETANNVVNALSRATKAVDYIVKLSGMVPACDCVTASDASDDDNGENA